MPQALDLVPVVSTCAMCSLAMEEISAAEQSAYDAVADGRAGSGVGDEILNPNLDIDMCEGSGNPSQRLTLQLQKAT